MIGTSESTSRIDRKIATWLCVQLQVEVEQRPCSPLKQCKSSIVLVSTLEQRSSSKPTLQACWIAESESNLVRPWLSAHSCWRNQRWANKIFHAHTKIMVHSLSKPRSNITRARPIFFVFSDDISFYFSFAGTFSY